MAIKFRCNCGKDYAVSDDYAGKKVKCKLCNAVLIVPAREEEIPTLEPVQPSPTPATQPQPVQQQGEEKQTGGFFDTLLWGIINPALICPHCQTKGKVHSKMVKRKTGISGGKVMGGLLTGGLSVLGTGLSQKKQVTQAHCDNCDSTWDF